ncbi:hypothetical protein HK097_008977 [Rhizophlyctis rosea]|uniref:Uncharacterized protein n=1 Tax=Rhizophlyctis rosea TaxID=64517 RepID=A0AAD5SB63_9FUNG|nr:hypothetical protein HK097_008977 [Rhizophlyctis rosea]
MSILETLKDCDLDSLADALLDSGEEDTDEVTGPERAYSPSSDAGRSSSMETCSEIDEDHSHIHSSGTDMDSFERAPSPSFDEEEIDEDQINNYEVQYNVKELPEKEKLTAKVLEVIDRLYENYTPADFGDKGKLGEIVEGILAPLTETVAGFDMVKEYKRSQCIIGLLNIEVGDLEQELTKVKQEVVTVKRAASVRLPSRAPSPSISEYSEEKEDDEMEVDGGGPRTVTLVNRQRKKAGKGTNPKSKTSGKEKKRKRNKQTDSTFRAPATQKTCKGDPPPSGSHLPSDLPHSPNLPAADFVAVHDQPAAADFVAVPDKPAADTNDQPADEPADDFVAVPDKPDPNDSSLDGGPEPAPIPVTPTKPTRPVEVKEEYRDWIHFGIQKVNDRLHRIAVDYHTSRLEQVVVHFQMPDDCPYYGRYPKDLTTRWENLVDRWVQMERDAFSAIMYEASLYVELLRSQGQEDAVGKFKAAYAAAAEKHQKVLGKKMISLEKWVERWQAVYKLADGFGWKEKDGPTGPVKKRHPFIPGPGPSLLLVIKRQDLYLFGSGGHSLRDKDLYACLEFWRNARSAPPARVPELACLNPLLTRWITEGKAHALDYEYKVLKIRLEEKNRGGV